MQEPFLSVIVPAYNAQPYLKTCLDSIVSQEFQDLEIIIIDDGSDDGSSEICQFYAERHNHIKLIRQENRGVLRARQTAVAEAAGKYIGFVDADDWIDPAMFDRLCSSARLTGAEIAVCDYVEHSNDDTRICGLGREPGLYAGEKYENKILVHLFSSPDKSAFSPLSTQWNAIVEANIAKREIGLIPEGLSLGEDTAFIMSCALDCGSLAYVDEPLYHYRIHGGSATQRGWHDRPEELSRQRELLYRHLAKRTEDRMISRFLGQLESYMLFLAWLDLHNYFASADNRNKETSDRKGAERYLAAPWLQELLKLERMQPQPQRWTEVLTELEPDGPFFSIVVLAYNVGPFLRQCLDSILNQTFQDFEAIVVDDGSTDDCPAICDEYAARDKRFVVIHQENGGIAKARKTAAELVRGTYLGAVDGDDWIEADCLSKVYDKLWETTADILQFDNFYNMPREIRVGSCRYLPQGSYAGNRFEQDIIGPYRKRDFVKHSIINSSLCTKFIKTSLLVPEIRELKDNFIFGEDAACVFLCLAKATSFYYLKENLYHYRRRPESSTHLYDPQCMTRTIELRQHVRHRLQTIKREDLNQLPDVVYLRLLLLHLFMVYAYSGGTINKKREIRRLLKLEFTRTAIKTVSLCSANVKITCVVFMIKIALPPPYFLVKPKLPKEGLFVRR
jgi:glycosyltransferase involved in cell wall biosynthesis